MPTERVELGYVYCTGRRCQAIHHRGLQVTTVGTRKSADVVVSVARQRRRR